MNKYQILEIIQQGAYGRVWKGLHRQTKTIVAIKQYKQSDKNQIIKKQIERQIKILKYLKSKYVVQLKHAYKKKGIIYLILQYINRNLLIQIQSNLMGLHPKQIKQIIYKLIRCLQYLHNNNIIHRDIKPQNILMSYKPQLQIKFCDFGQAKNIQQQQQLTHYVGTRWYRSPQMLIGDKYGKQNDMWAIGCVLGQLVLSKPMFPGKDSIEQLSLIIQTVEQNLSNNQKQLLLKKLGPNNSNIFQQISTKTNKNKIDNLYVGRIQKNALNFLKQCLKINPQERLTAQNALKHPYLLQLYQKDKLSTDSSSPTLIQQNKQQKIKQFNRSPQKIIKNYSSINHITNNLSNDSKANLNQYHSVQIKLSTSTLIQKKQIRISQSPLQKKINKFNDQKQSPRLSMISNKKSKKIIYNNSQKSIIMPSLPGLKNIHSNLLKNQLINSQKILNTIFHTYGNALSINGKSKSLSRIKNRKRQ